MDYKALGERIRCQRNKMNLTQEELAEKVGISASFMGHIERGSRKLSLETLVKISNITSANIAYLLQDSVKAPADTLISEAVKNLKISNEKQLKTFILIIEQLAENFDKWNYLI